MITSTNIIIRTHFVGYHRWRGAPDDVSFLRDFHRHVFHVEVKIPVTHDDREKEFFLEKAKIQSYLKKHYEQRRFDASCEQIARTLLLEFRAAYVCVSEDGENGSEVYAYPNRVDQVKMPSCFIGREAEGPLYESDVLFVPYSQVSKLADAIRREEGVCAEELGIEGIYIGAGNDRVDGWDVPTYRDLQYLLRVSRITKTVETTMPALCASSLDVDPETLFVHYCTAPNSEHIPEFELGHHYIKHIDGTYIYWHNMRDGSVYKTWLHHPFFLDDRPITI